MTTSTFLKMPRRSNFCLASWDFLITCSKHWVTYSISKWLSWALLLFSAHLCSRAHTSIRFFARKTSSSSYVSRSSLVLPSPSTCTRWTTTWETENTKYKYICTYNTHITLPLYKHHLWRLWRNKYLTSLFSRISCFGSCSISGASMSSAWTPSSGPCMGRGSRLCSAEEEEVNKVTRD